MNGNKKAEHGITDIVFSSFFTHPDFRANQPVSEKDVAWSLHTDFRIVDRKPYWDHLTIVIKAKLLRKSDKAKISELKTESSFKVTAGMTFDYKFKMICQFINTAIGHLKGGWVIKHSNPNLKAFLLQAYFKESLIEGELKKNVYERWD
jgi:hypothetical protein